MANKFEVLYFVICLTSIIGYQCSEVPKPTYTRTMLKVSRSLPGETEELKVRTSEGKLTTLIVKRKERPPIFDNIMTLKSYPNSQVEHEKENTSFTRLNLDNPPSWSSKTQNDVRPLEIAQIQRIRAHLNKTNDSEVKNSNNSDKQIAEDRNQVNNKAIDYGNWRPIGDTGRSQEEKKDLYVNWKPVPTENKVSKDDLIFASSFQDRRERKLDSREENSQGYVFFPHEPRPLKRTNIGANLMKNRGGKNVPPEVTITSELNVKTTPEQAPIITVDNIPTIYGQRVPDDAIDKIQTWRNARVINNRLIPEGAMSVTVDPSTLQYPSDNLVEKQKFEKFFKDVNSRFGRNFNDDGRNVYYEWEPKNYQHNEYRSEPYEYKNENYRPTIQKRMLHPESVSSFPKSPVYTPESQKIAPLTLKPGARAPVLQYAHPELGVQPAKILKNEKRRPDNFPENQHSFTEQRHKKKYVLNDKNIVDSYTLKNYYPNQHFYGLKKPDAPFWVKISENLKNQFSTGVEKVSQFTRPVFDPLVEATQKISQNLGLSKSQEAQEKIGTVASSSSILIPALGLVASGAALGIGAVAVGRYLDVDMLKRSNEGSVEIEQTRALESIPKFVQSEDEATSLKEELPEDQQSTANPENVFLILEETQPQSQNEQQSSHHRRKRSIKLDDFDIDESNHIRTKRFQRKGADLITDIVEIDVPAKGNIDITELLVPKSSKEKETDDNSILLVEDGSVPLGLSQEGINQNIENQDALDRMVKIVDEIVKKTDEQREQMKKLNSRRRRSLDMDHELEDALQNLETAAVAEIQHISGDWTNTPCAKKMFCDAMIEKGPDAAIFMEKRMDSLLGLIQPGAAAQVSGHFEEVMEAVRRDDCSKFVCLQARQGNVFF